MELLQLWHFFFGSVYNLNVMLKTPVQLKMQEKNELKPKLIHKIEVTIRDKHI